MNTSRRRLLARLLQGGAVLTAAGLLPTHTVGMEKRDKKGNTTQEGSTQTRQVASIADMQALDVSRLQDGQRIQVAGYHAGETLGGGELHLVRP